MISVAIVGILAVAVAALLVAVFVAMWLFTDVVIHFRLLWFEVKIEGHNRRRPPML